MAVIKFRRPDQWQEQEDRRNTYNDEYGEYGEYDDYDDYVADSEQGDYSERDDYYADDTKDSYTEQTGRRAASRPSHLKAVPDKEIKQLRKKRRQRIAEALALAAVLILLVFLIVSQSGNRTFTAASYTQLNGEKTLSGANYSSLSGKIVCYSKDGAYCMESDGTMIWNTTFEMQRPIVSKTESIFAVADYNGTDIYIFNAKQQLCTIKTSLPIRSISVSQSGEVAAVLAGNEETWFYLYDAKGDQIAYSKMTMQQSGYPLALAVSPGGTLLAVSHLTIGTAAPNTSIAFYNFGSVGQNSVENLVSGFNYDNEVFPYLAFMNDKTCVAVSDGRISYFDGDQVPKNGKNIMIQDRIMGVWNNSQYLAVVTPDPAGGKGYLMKVYNTAGNEVGKIQIAMEYSDIQMVRDRIIVSNSNEVQIFTTAGTCRYSGAFRSDVKTIIPTDRNDRFVIVTDEDIEQMNLE